MGLSTYKKRQMTHSIFLYKNGKMVSNLTSPLKTRIFNRLQGEDLEQNGIYGMCKVTYDKGPSVYNKFHFKTLREFTERLAACSEPTLLRFISEGDWS